MTSVFLGALCAKSYGLTWNHGVRTLASATSPIFPEEPFLRHPSVPFHSESVEFITEQLGVLMMDGLYPKRSGAL